MTRRDLFKSLFAIGAAACASFVRPRPASGCVCVITMPSGETMRFEVAAIHPPTDRFPGVRLVPAGPVEFRR